MTMNRKVVGQPPPQTHRTLWAGLLAAGAAVVLGAQLVLVTSSIQTVDRMLHGELTMGEVIHDHGLRLLPWLSMIELMAGIAGIVVVATTRPPARRVLLAGGFVVLTALAVCALTIRPAMLPGLLIRLHDYHRLRVLYAIALPFAVVTTGLAWWTRCAHRMRPPG